VFGEVGAVGIGGRVSEKDEVVFGGHGKGEGVFEIGCEFVESFRGGPSFRSSGEFDIGIEPVEIGTAAACRLEAFEVGNEIFVESGFTTTFFIEGSDALGADGGEGEVELLVPGVPITLGILFPSPEPF